jgi:hypothetical protein
VWPGMGTGGTVGDLLLVGISAGGWENILVEVCGI